MIEYNDERHEYRIAGVVVPSVTQVIAPLGPDLSFVDAELLERASNFGRAVHAACEQDDNDMLDEAELSAPLVPYLDAWRKFKADLDVKILRNEEIVYSDVWKIAGRLDRMATLRGKLAVIDIKTCSTIHRVTGVQLAGYEQCARDLGVILRRETVLRLAVQLLDGGFYVFKRYEDPTDKQAFIACTQLFHWRKNNGYKI